MSEIDVSRDVFDIGFDSNSEESTEYSLQIKEWTPTYMKV